MKLHVQTTWHAGWLMRRQRLHVRCSFVGVLVVQNVQTWRQRLHVAFCMFWMLWRLQLLAALRTGRPMSCT